MTAFTLATPIPQQIVANGQDVFEVLMYEWGTNVKDTYPPILSAAGTALNSPGFPFTPQAITIGPRSTIDRAFVSWNYQQKFSTQVRSMTRVLSVDTPLLFPQTANAFGQGITSTAADPVLGDAQGGNFLYVAPHIWPTTITEVANPGYGVSDQFMSTLLPTGYLKADGTAVNTFYNPAGTTLVERPILHLQFHLKAGTQLPAKRFPYHQALQTVGIAAVGSEELIFGWPVYGRKIISIQTRTSAASATFRIGALRNVQRYYAIQETTEGELSSTASNESVRFRFCDLAADYLMLYVNRTSAVGGADIFATITATD